MLITIQELLVRCGLPKDAKAKLVRHKDHRQNVYDLYRFHRDKFEDYQAIQSKPVFHELDYIVSFIGEEGRRARFVGVYRVLRVQPIEEVRQTIENPNDKYFYTLEEVGGFERLKERVIINWSNPISWHQKFCNEMEVIEISSGFDSKPFPGYLDFILTFDELTELVNTDNEEWRHMLSNVYGVYVIRDTKTDKLYIGSAYGKEGIWQRWEVYVKTNGHGNNKTLKELVGCDPDYSRNFAFSLLMIMSKNTPDDQVIAQEQLLKQKLGAEYCNN